MQRPQLDSLGDQELVSAFQRDPEARAGREAADVLLRRWRGRIIQWCYRMVRDQELATDLAQECLTRIYRALPRFEPRAAVSSWFFQIVRNRCLSALRSRSLARDPDVDMDELQDPLVGPEDSAAARHQLDRVIRVMEEVLDPMEQSALWLRAHEGMPVDEITRLLGIRSASGARGVLQTARQKLRAALGSEAPEVRGET